VLPRSVGVYFKRQLKSDDGVKPSSRATASNGFPDSSSWRTAPRLNSSLKTRLGFVCFIGLLMAIVA
jgi:hypothetical protein